jgi:class 3 adenylate cyclase
MAEPVSALGGEICKFAGDSLIVMFPALPSGDDTHLGTALACALRMRQAVSNSSRVDSSAGTFTLQIKIGMSAGKIYTTTVGDETSGMQPVFAGRALVRSMQAEELAEAGEIVMDAALTSRMPRSVDIGEARGTFRLVLGAADLPLLPPKRHSAVSVDVSTLEPERMALLIQRLTPYLPAQVIERVYRDQRAEDEHIILSEYRRVTVMFVRFAGLDYDVHDASSSLAPGHILQAYFVAMRDCVLRHGGRLNEVDITASGGILVAFFGALMAHEDDELRAVSCAWEMQQRLPPGLRQCVGVSNGALFAGDVGAAVRRAYAAVGDEVNLASRVVNLARWGEVVVTGWIRRRTERRFRYRALGELDIRGKKDRVSLSLLVTPRRPATKDGIVHRLLNQRPPLVGRSAELAALKEIQEQARQGEPQLLLISGEAGVGKSRLAGELAQAWVHLGGRVYGADCRRRGNDVPYDPWITMLRAVFHLWGDDPQQHRSQIENELALLSPSLAGEGAIMFDALVARPLVGRLQARWRKTVLELVRSVARQQPLLLVIEDLQDMDEPSWALWRALLDALGTLPDDSLDGSTSDSSTGARVGGPGSSMPVLVCGTYRPNGDLYPDSMGLPTARLWLEPLVEADSLSLARQLLIGASLPHKLAPALARQAGGNPFYLEEMVWSLRGTRDPVLAVTDGMPVPEPISHTILAQIDPLGEGFRLTLQIAAVIGQLFSFSVLQAAHPAPISRHDLADRLAKLERMHIVRLAHIGAGSPHCAGENRARDCRPDVYYCFRHDMAQQVIYAGLLKTDRERLHRRVGYALEQTNAADRDPPYGLLAEHFQRGGVVCKAINYALLAGHRAAQARAVREALTFYDRAEEMLLDREVASAEGKYDPRCRQGVHLVMLLCRARVRRQLLDIPKAVEDYERALELASQVADLGSQGQALLCLGDIAVHQARYLPARMLIQQAIQRFSALDDRRSLAQAWLLLSRAYALQGQFMDTMPYVELAEATDSLAQRPLMRSGLVYSGGLRERDDPLVSVLPDVEWNIPIYRAWLQTLYWAPDRLQVDRLLECDWSPRNRGTSQGLVMDESLLWLSQVLAHRGKWGQSMRLARESMAAGWAAGTLLDVADAKRVLAWTLTQVGAYDEAIDYVSEAMTAYVEAGWRVGMASGFCTWGEALCAQGRYKQASECFHQALAMGRETHTVQALVGARIGLGRVAAARQQWHVGERWYVAARANARQANLSGGLVDARLGLARVYLGNRDFARAQRQAAYAFDMCGRLEFRYGLMHAALILGEACVGLGHVVCERQWFEQALQVAQQLASSLPADYARIFWEQPYMRTVKEVQSGYALGRDMARARSRVHHRAGVAPH